MTEITLYRPDPVTSWLEPITELYQWDSNQTVYRSGTLSAPPEFHFCNCKSTSAYVVTASGTSPSYYAQVPNILLQDNERIIVYIYKVGAGNVGQTIEVAYLPVVPRPRPDDYEYYDDMTGITLADIDTRVTALEAAIAGGGGGSGGGDIADGSVTTAKLAANAVTNAKMAKMAAYTIKGNNSNAQAVPSDISRASFRSMFAMAGASISSAGTAGFVPAPPAGSGNKVLCGDGQWRLLSDLLTDGDEVGY